MVKKVLFLNPPFSADELYGDLSEGGSELPPFGLTLLAAITREKGYKTSIIDAAALKLTYQQTADRIIDARPDVLGITSTTITIYNAGDVASIIKARNPSIKIVVGGPHMSACPKETMEAFPAFDVGVVGEGDITLVELLEYFHNNRDLTNCRGLILRKGNEFVLTGQREFLENLDSLPLPAWDLLPNLAKYYQPAADSLYRSPATLLITSRGCPGQCVFCDNRMFGNKLRAHSAEYVIKMIEYLQKNYGIKDIFFEDDNFLVFTQRIKDFCHLLKQKKIDLTFSVMGRVDAITPEKLKMLKEAGCWQVGYGCESGSQKILDNINKRITVERIEKALRMTYQAGLKIKGLFMIGNFGETKETIQETLDFIKRVPMDDFHINCFTPLPGAAAYNVAHKYGQFDPDWRKASMIAPDNFVPYGLTCEELLYYHKKAYKTFYLRPRIICYYLLKMMKSKKLFLKILRGGIAFFKYTVLKGGLKKQQACA